MLISKIKQPWRKYIRHLKIVAQWINVVSYTCLLYTSDAADERSSVDLGGRRIIKKKKTLTLCGSVETIIVAKRNSELSKGVTEEKMKKKV